MTIRGQHKSYSRLFLLLFPLTITLWLNGCMMVGPDYVRPVAPMTDSWIDPGDPAVRREPADVSAWWTVFNDPVLNTLVETAYRQNPSLRAAGVRVLEAQARRGIAIGLLFPQQQETFGSATSNQASKNRANRQFLATDEYDDWQVGFCASCELTTWS